MRRRVVGLTETVIEGTLQPDGTLVLDDKPNLPPGRVTVVLRQPAGAKPAEPPGDAFFQMMEGIWAGQRARGHVPRPAADVEEERRETRDSWEERQQAIERLQEECRRRRQQVEGGGEESP